MPEFTPTRFELIQLVKSWETIYIGEDYFVWWAGQYDSKIRYLKNVCLGRIREIADLIGEEVAGAAIDEAREDFGRLLDPREWNLFQTGASLPPPIAKKMNASVEVTDADWEAFYKRPKEVAKEHARRRRVPAPK